MKPSIVFFGEQLPKEFHSNFKKDLRECDLVIVLGSSLKVGPVNDYTKYLPENVKAFLKPDSFSVNKSRNSRKTS